MRPSQNCHCTCTIPCMVTQAFYTSTTLCILSWSHNVLQCQYFWHFGQSHPQYFTFIRPSPVHNQWQSLYYHCGLGPNVAKTEQLPQEFYAYLSPTSNINQENHLDKHAPVFSLWKSVQVLQKKACIKIVACGIYTYLFLFIHILFCSPAE